MKNLTRREIYESFLFRDNNISFNGTQQTKGESYEYLQKDLEYVSHGRTNYYQCFDCTHNWSGALGAGAIIPAERELI